MASYMPVEVQRDLEQIAYEGGSPATKIGVRIAQPEGDSESVALPKGKATDLKKSLCRRLSKNRRGDGIGAAVEVTQVPNGKIPTIRKSRPPSVPPAGRHVALHKTERKCG
jgi:hypothetical protein